MLRIVFIKGNIEFIKNIIKSMKVEKSINRKKE